MSSRDIASRKRMSSRDIAVREKNEFKRYCGPGKE
jgi:hypothetical protein